VRIETAAFESPPPLIFTAGWPDGKRKEAGHYSGLLRTTLKFFVEAALPSTKSE
jgi:hypothetical protein